MGLNNVSELAELTSKIFEIRTSLEDNRPEIDFELPENGEINWGLIGEYIGGHRPAQEYLPIKITILDKLATEWDFYFFAAPFGMFSAKAVDVLGEKSFKNYHLFPAQINGADYFFLKCLERLDCLNKKKSVYTAFTDVPDRFMLIEKYAFDLEKIDAECFFSIPQNENLYCSQVQAKVITEKLRGIRLLNLPVP
jgi:hypothetical protein